MLCRQEKGSTQPLLDCHEKQLVLELAEWQQCVQIMHGSTMCGHWMPGCLECRCAQLMSDNLVNILRQYTGHVWYAMHRCWQWCACNECVAAGEVDAK